LKWAVLVAFVIPYFWIVLMRQHASVHVFYLPRNWIVTFIVGALALALSVQRRPLAPQVAAADPEPPPPPAPEPEPLAEGTT
jgi:peptidoglycan/LPS O-acetylase OafA/YrhL